MTRPASHVGDAQASATAGPAEPPQSAAAHGGLAAESASVNVQAVVGSGATTSVWGRLHASLMPDYNLKTTVYWWSVVLLGAAVVGWSLLQLVAKPADVWLQIALFTGFAMLAGLVPVRVPGSSNAFAAGEIFIFLLLLSCGIEAAAVASACEAMVASARMSKRWTSRIASPAMAALALFVAASPLQWLLATPQGQGPHADTWLLIGAVCFALAYFVFNTLLVTMVPRLKRNERLNLHSLLGSFGWLGLAYAANASVATFLYMAMREWGIAVAIAAIPVIAVLLSSGHYYFRRKEAGEAVRSAQASEAAQTRRHLGELEASERRFHSAFTHASIGMALVSFDGRIRQVNTSLRTLLGMTDRTSSRLDFNEFVASDGVTTLANLLATIEAGTNDVFAAELRCRHPDGQDVWVALNGSLFSEPGSDEACLILQMQDISGRKRAERELHHLAFHDSLTGLPNRHRFSEHLIRAIARAQTDPMQQFGVLFLDFDRFKLINDSMGHTVGDEFLVQASRRLEAGLRPGDVVARLGGDEFAILAEQRGASQQAVLTLAERLQDMLRRPFYIGGTDVMTSVSMGITFSSIGYRTPEEILRDADIAMYMAKAAGKARYAIFDAGLHEKVAGRLRLEGDLRQALGSGGLSVHYQPLIDLRSGALLGFEALARWSHPELGSLSPAEFIPIAEESGSIVQLTDFVLSTACHQLKRWQMLDPLFAKLKMHVNVAGNDITGNQLVARVARVLVGARLTPESLSIELTENILMERLEAAIGTLNELSALGVGLDVDDFGTGYSSLGHLASLPIGSLKIDRSFVQDLRPDSKQVAIVRAIVLLGKATGKQVIAEGIETQQQLDALRDLGCDVGQGYLLARPQAADSIEALLSEMLRGFARGQNGWVGFHGAEAVSELSCPP